ncbi:PEGA domain-containing protein [Archangium lansingense]|uniref:PEGA domain-containing protein n=1 Tax=Archangium lansingense TaxID=2995310 RepID=A0ABT4AHB6_9BACT|nr:PEGA domain-containing protein [Archangium lansinium]MCY1081078.1 PEGA domain-containing protein [Archangium lansinium]
MLLCRAFLIALVLCLAAPSAYAQGMDDLLAPLTPSGKKGKGKAKTTQRRTPKASKKATKATKGKKGKGAKATPPEESEPEQAEGSDLLLAPLVKKTELLVKMNGSVRGARFFLNEKEMGAMPKGPIEVDPGEHVVSVRRPGYRNFTQRINAKEGELTELAVLMEPTAGFVSVKADVEGARVLINGEDKGVAPLDSLMLAAGSYEIVVQREGFRPESQRIAVRAGKEYNVDVNLRPEAVAQADSPRAPVLTPSSVSEPSPLTQQPVAELSSRPLTSRWYFWAGVGAVVTAAAVGTVMATQQQPLDPDKVCGGTCDGVINRPTSGGLFQF